MNSDTAIRRSPEDEAEIEFIREAVEQAHVNALRMALYQVTNDPEIGAMRPLERLARGREFLDFQLDENERARVQSKAIEYLMNRTAEAQSLPPPTREQARSLIDMFSGPVSDDAFRFAYEELAYEEFPRDTHWTRKPASEKLANFNVIIIGAGISGLAAALQFKRLGISFIVIERQSGLGGTWLLNTYPEVRVDTLSMSYQFKFEKNFPWTEYFASGDETRRYLEYIAEKYGVKDDVKYDREVVAAKWDESSSRWHIKVKHKRGCEEMLEANVIVSASGLLSTPKLPDIAGIKDYEGQLFHTARWNYDFDYRGKRVALIGTGSTGTQLAPGLAREASHLTVYQRTPTWIIEQPKYRAAVSPHLQWLYANMPYYWNWYCYACYFTGMQMQHLQSYDPDWQAKGGMVSERNDRLRGFLTEYIRSEVGDDPVLFDQLLPKYAPLTRRIAVSNGFYKTLRRDNVELVTQQIDRITKRGIVTKDGKEREFDLIVFGTGFKVQQYFWPVNYVGRDGVTIEVAWQKDGARSYLGLAMPGFPNLFTFVGPNGAPRAGGFYSWAEVWARYIATAVVNLIENDDKSLEVKRSVFDDYNAKLDEEMKKMIWEAEGRSYYVNEHGRTSVNVPWVTQKYHAMVAEPNFDHYDVR